MIKGEEKALAYSRMPKPTSKSLKIIILQA